MIKLELTVNELNLIFSALAKAPYESVINIIENIRKQALPQLEETPTDK
jgi:hypothetical protein